MSMLRQTLALSLGLAVLAGSAMSAAANGGVIYTGGMKDTIREAVPVPAPVPIPIYEPKYYFRLDAGIGMGDKPDATEDGMYYGADSMTGRFGSEAFLFNNDFEEFVTFGAGVGTYIGPHWRADFTAETRTQAKVKIDGTYSYRVDADNNAVADDAVYGDVRDETTLRGGIFLLNGYYDFRRYSHNWIKPYIGAGVGFAWSEIKRNHFTNEYFDDCDDGGINCAGAVPRAATNIQDKKHVITVAAQASAGFTYDISESSALDFNYRFIYIGGLDNTAPLGARAGFGGGSTVSIDDMFEHQLRAGIRFNVN